MKKSDEKAERFNGIETGAAKSWMWLRKQPQYQAAYKEQGLFLDEKRWKIKSETERTKATTECVSKIKKNWGFFPLENPNENKVPIGIIGAILDLIGRAPDGAIRLMNINGVSLILQTTKTKLSENQKKELQSYLEKPVPKPNFLNIDVDYNQPDDEIWKDLKNKLKLFRSFHGIRPKRLSERLIKTSDNLYKAFVLGNLGCKPQEIQMEIFGKKDQYPDQEYQKQTARLRKRVQV